MEKKELRIVVVEDDATLGKALTEAVKTAGYQAQLYARPDDVLAAAKYNPPHLYIIDMMLPKTNGEKLSILLRANGASDTPIILTSGMFKNKLDIKGYLQNTKAVSYIIKPFRVEDVITEIDKQLADIIDVEIPKEPLLEILSFPNPKPGDRLRAVEQTPQLNGLEIPRVLGLLSARSISGILSLAVKDSEPVDPIRIHYSNGAVCRVDMKVPNSLFGSLILEKGLVDPDEMKVILDQKSDRPIGERLVDACLLSPHQIHLISTQQLGIRLSEAISEKTYDMTFTPSKVSGDPIIESNQLAPFQSEWVRLKIPTSWLKTFYLPWLDNVIHTTEDYSAHHLVTKLDPMGRFPILNKMIHPGPTTIQVLLSSSNVPEEDIYSAVHLMTMSGLIYFDKNNKIQETTGQQDRLERIKKDLEGKNHFEVLGIGKNSKATDSKRAYFEFAKAFHPDKLPPNATAEVRQLTTEIFNRMSAAYEVLKDEKLRADYLRQLDQGQAAQVLQAESLMEEGRALIKANQATKALVKFKEASLIRPPTSDMKLHTMWARIALLSHSANEQEDLLDVRRQLDRIPPEDRHTAMYYFVKALFQKTVGELDLAKSNLKQCLILDINFKDAQRELNMINLAGQNKGGGDIFNKDLTTVIGSLFKKGKK